MITKKTHVIVVDDNPEHIKLLVRLLNTQNATVTYILDSFSVIEYTDEIEKSHVIFMDLEMPNLSGISVKQHIHRISSTTKIIAHSAHSDRIPLLKAVGFDGFIGKPIDIDRFPHQFDAILKGIPVWDI